jgi:hypothetical protein
MGLFRAKSWGQQVRAAERARKRSAWKPAVPESDFKRRKRAAAPSRRKKS